MYWLLGLGALVGVVALIYSGYVIGWTRRSDKTLIAELSAKKQSEVAHDYKHTAEIFALPGGNKRDTIDKL